MSSGYPDETPHPPRRRPRPPEDDEEGGSFRPLVYLLLLAFGVALGLGAFSVATRNFGGRPGAPVAGPAHRPGGQPREAAANGPLDADEAEANRVFEAAKGAVVNVTSIAGSRVHPFAGAAYATTKAALASLTREMAADFGPLGVRVNAIAPGEIDTAILSPGTEKIVETIPLRRLGLPEEVAKAIWYLCTEQSSYVTGAELHINGGEHV